MSKISSTLQCFSSFYWSSQHQDSSQCIGQCQSFSFLSSSTDNPLPQLMKPVVFQCLQCFETQKPASSFHPILS